MSVVKREYSDLDGGDGVDGVGATERGGGDFGEA